MIGRLGGQLGALAVESQLTILGLSGPLIEGFAFPQRRYVNMDTRGCLARVCVLDLMQADFVCADLLLATRWTRLESDIS